MRRHGEQVVITHAGPGGPAEVARHQVTAPGSPRVDDAHYPPAPPGALGRTPKARTAAEAQFLAIGDGAGLWLAEAAAAGTARVRAKMAEAVQLAALHGPAAVDQALGRAAAAGPVRRRRPGRDPRPPGRCRGGPGAVQAGEQRTLAQGTSRVGAARRDGGGPMTLRGPDHDIRLTSERVELIRDVLAACSQLLHWAERRGDGQFRAELDDAARCGQGRPHPRPAPV